MKGRLLFSALAFFVMAAPSAAFASPEGRAAPFGLWLTQSGRAIVRIAPCDAAPAKACGRIAWLREPLDNVGQAKTDRNNHDETLRNAPLCSTELVKSFGRSDDGTWSGMIYNPRDGKSYAAKITADPGQLVLRGYVLLPIFGKAQTWTRVADDRGGC
ncbi:MAG: DUF2147 domain-containing protein [Paracoccaceae bacterium]|nr:DUF2147 domain-containing protein [Paracoccaceae bacterium]